MCVCRVAGGRGGEAAFKPAELWVECIKGSRPGSGLSPACSICAAYSSSLCLSLYVPCHAVPLCAVPCHAVISVATCRKQSAYRAVLAVLNAALADGCFRHVRQQLAAVLDPARSSVFEQIIY